MEPEFSVLEKLTHGSSFCIKIVMSIWLNQKLYGRFYFSTYQWTNNSATVNNFEPIVMERGGTGREGRGHF